MQLHCENIYTRVGMISIEPMRLMGLVSAFENHSTIRIHIGDLETLLEDRSLRYLILDVSHTQRWLELVNKAHRLRPDVQQIVVGPNSDEELMLRSIAAGVRAFLDFSCGPLAVRQAVEAVIRGCIWAPRSVLTRLIDRLLSQNNSVAPLPIPTFSPRERQVLDLIMTACSNREIASELGIEERTVKAYVASLMRKTGADNRVSLSVQATQSVMREQRLQVS
jgi:DNA-binding NarL/FixJ family response regulator